MFYAYVLQSTINKDVYVGYTADLKKRFKRHNNGNVISTRPYKPWKLIYYEAYKHKLDATIREKKLKMHAVKKELLVRLVKSIGE